MSKAHSLLITLTFVLISLQLDHVENSTNETTSSLQDKELTIFDYRKMYNLRFNPSNLVKSDGEMVFEGVEEETTEEIVEEVSSEPESNIMKPNNRTLMYNVNLIGNRLRNVLFGNGQTVLNAPKKGKGLLNLFDIIQFENTVCSFITDINEVTGICYSALECITYGGVAVDSCAQGVGVCCVFDTSCGDKSNQMITYFKSSNYPSTSRDAMVCVFTLELRKNVKQVLLEFVMMELSRPTEGDCINDQFIVSGHNMNVKIPIICGINTGQHLYIPVSDVSEKQMFLSVFSKNISPRAFNVKITQLQSNVAPDGCLQYFTTTNGVITSFNYEEDGVHVDSREASYLNNLNYAICIRRGSEMCSISYLNEINGIEYPFAIFNSDGDDNLIVPRGQAGADVFSCPDDFIAINQLRLCGEKLNDGNTLEDYRLNSIVKDNWNGPLVVAVRTDELLVGRGFKILYYQDVC